MKITKPERTCECGKVFDAGCYWIENNCCNFLKLIIFIVLKKIIILVKLKYAIVLFIFTRIEK